jgi:hypothetical protein
MHPVLAELRRQVADHRRRFGLEATKSPNYIVWTRVIKYGKPYTRITKPKGLRWRTEKECFYNSYTAVMNKPELHLHYVEGYVLGGTSLLVHHAWVTADGHHAIDLTLRVLEPTAKIPFYVGYYGVAIPIKFIARKLALDRQLWGQAMLYYWDPSTATEVPET